MIGIIKEYKNIIEDNIAKNYFNKLLEEIEWEIDEYNLMGNIVKSPRKVAYYGDKNYSYSGTTKIAKPYIPLLNEIQNIVCKELRLENNYFNGVLLNLYRDGKDYMGYHTDNENEMEETIIVGLSLGQKRKFYFKNNSTKEVSKYSMDNGNMIVMYPKCQQLFKHSIPKELRIKEPRISLTFRRFK